MFRARRSKDPEASHDEPFADFSSVYFRSATRVGNRVVSPDERFFICDQRQDEVHGAVYKLIEVWPDGDALGGGEFYFPAHELKGLRIAPCQSETSNQLQAVEAATQSDEILPTSSQAQILDTAGEDSRVGNSVDSGSRSDSGTDTSDPSSGFSSRASLESESSTASDGHVVQTASEQVADFLVSDAGLSALYPEALAKLGKNRFLKYHDRLLRKFFAALSSETQNELQVRVVKVLQGRSRRAKVTNLICSISDETDPKKSQALTHLKERRPDREHVLRQYLQGPDKPPIPASIEMAQQTRDEDDSDTTDESEAEDEDKDDFWIQGDDQLASIKHFIMEGPPFHKFTTGLRGFVHPPTSVKEAIACDNVKILRQLLETRFDTIVAGEYSWLSELDELGYTCKEIAAILLENAADAPWIYFEPAVYQHEAPKLDFHLSNCIHQRSAGDNSPETSIPAAETPQTTNESDIRHAVQQLCGLAGVTPISPDERKWNGTVIFKSENSKASVSYAFKAEFQNNDRGVLSRILKALEGFCTAASIVQSSGFCCDSFTVVTRRQTQSDRLDSKSEMSSTVEMSQIKLIFAVELLNRLRGLYRAGKPSKQAISSTVRLARRILEPLSIITGRYTPGDFDNHHLHLCSLATQFLCLGFLSYIQAHIGPVRPFFLDTKQTEFHLMGRGLSADHGTTIKAEFLRLTCLEEMVQAPVLTFFMDQAQGSSNWAGENPRYDLKASPEDLLDTWGPGQLVYHRDGEDKPCAIAIRGGLLYPSDKGHHKFHWDRSYVFEDKAPKAFDLDTKILIGALVTVNENCTIDEERCFQESCPQLSPLGTFASGWENRERQAGFQVGQYFLGQYNSTWQKIPGKTLKQSQLEKGNEFLPSFLETTWGLQVSYCTGVARRVLMRELVADVLPMFANTLFHEPDLWEELNIGHNVIDALHNPHIHHWLKALNPELRVYFLQMVRHILEVFKDTGVERSGKYLIVAWPREREVLRCFKLPCEKENYWARMLADSEDSATFAYVSPKCLEAEKTKCRSPSPAWQNISTSLETAVMVRRDDPPLARRTLEHEKAYLIEKMDSIILLKVHRPDAADFTTLIVSESKIQQSLQRRLLQKRNCKLKERQGLNEPAEPVLISTRKLLFEHTR